MQSHSPHIQHILVDGEQLLLPSRAAWRQLLVDPVIDGAPFAVPDLLRHNLLVTCLYDELVLALQQSGGRQAKWLPIVLLQYVDGWQRVHLERLTCNTCGWQGMTANPTIMDLYLGVPNRKVAEDRAWQHPVVPCPQCHSTLPRRPIWVQPLLHDTV